MIRKELKYAVELWKEKLPDDIYFIQLRLESCASPQELAEFQWIDFYKEDGMARLLSAIREGLKSGIVD